MDRVRAELVRRCEGGVCWWTDPELLGRSGVLVAFTERTGGRSAPPYDSLNLAFHVGDDPEAVECGRDTLFEALGIAALRGALVTAGQVHGREVAVVSESHAGAGARRPGVGCGSVEGVDALVTLTPELPLMLLFADCVPVVLVAEAPVRAVAVAHAGWRGAAAGVHVRAAESLCREAGCEPADLLVYVGPCVGPCHYEVGEEVLARFSDSDTIAAAPGRLDLGAIVSADLERLGVRTDRLPALGRCTAENTDSFFSYRADGRTGRHAALAVVRGGVA